MNRKRNDSRWPKRKRRPADGSAANRFFAQFDTKLRFRELEPRVVLDASATLDGNGVLQITSDKAGDAVEVSFYNDGVDDYYRVTDNNGYDQQWAASQVEGIAVNDISGAQDSQSLTLLDDNAGLNPSLSKGIVVNGIETVSFQGNNAGDAWSVAAEVTITADTNDAVVHQSGADLLTPLGTPVTFAAINGASIDVDLQGTGNEISLLAVDQGGDVKLATTVDLDVQGSSADLLQVAAPNVKLGADGLDSQFGALKIDLTATGDISQVGKLTVTGASDLNVVGGNVLLNDGANDFQDAVSVNATGGIDAASAVIADADDLQLGDVRTTSLTTITGGDLTQTLGTSVQVSDTVDFQFTSAGKTLDLQNAGNLVPTDDAKFLLSGPESPLNFYLRNDTTANAIPLAIRNLAGSGALNDLTLTYTQNVGPILLPTIDITGDLVYAANGTIAQDALTTIQVDGHASFTTLDNQDILLGNAGNDFNVISATGAATAGNVVIDDDDGDVSLDQIGATTLVVNAVGAIFNIDGASIQVSDNASLIAVGQVDVGNALGDDVRFGSLTFTSGSNVAIREDDAMNLVGVSSAVSLYLQSTAAITNADNAKLTVIGAAHFDGTSVDLGNATGDEMLFGSLIFTATGAVVILEDDSTQLEGENKAGSLVLNSQGAITNQATATLNVTGNALFAGTSVTLGNQASDEMKFGSLTFKSAGAVEIQEDDATVLAGTNTATSLNLASADTITDAALTSVTVTGPASFTATNAITLADNADTLHVTGLASFDSTKDAAIKVGGAASSTQFGSLNFNGGAVVIQEDDATILTGTNTAKSLNLTSADTITDAAKTSVTISGAATFTAVNAITLADAADTLHVTGLATFDSTADAALTVGGAASSTQFGSLNFNGGAVVIQEDDATVLSGTNTATSLELASADTITDLLGTDVTVTGPATFTAVGTIKLADDFGSLHVDGQATFTSTGGDISIGTALTSTLFGSLNFNGGVVTIEEDDALVLTGTNAATSLSLSSAGSITDAPATSVTVSGDALFSAFGDVVLADSTGDASQVDGLASFASATGAIAVGSADSSTLFGSIRFFGGDVSIQEDDATIISGASQAMTLNLASGGSITDASGASLTVNGDATFTAQDEIDLADNAGDTLSVVGLAKFISLSGVAIDVGVDNSVIRGTDSGATVNFGLLTFVSDDGAGGRDSVTIREDSGMNVTGVNLAADLFLAADGSIIQVEDGDAMTADRIDLDVNGDGSVVGDAMFEAAAGAVINLFGDTSANPLGEPVSSFLADNKIANAEFRAAGGGSLADVYYRNISAAALFPTLPSSLTGDLRIQFTAADIVIDSDLNVGDQLTLEALGTMAAIADVDGVSILAGDAIFVADGSITLADEALNSLIVGATPDDNAFFYSRGGKEITVGASDVDGTASGATVELASLTFYSGDGGSARGDVVIHETDSTLLASRRFDVDGTPVIFINQADSLVLITDGNLTDADSDGSLNETILRASVDVANSSVMIAGGEIHLADQAKVTVDGVDLGVYSLGLSDGAMDNDGALFATTAGGDIRVGVTDALATDSGAVVEVDGLTFNSAGGAGDVCLQTDGDTALANQDFAGTTYENLASDLVLRTTGGINSAGGDVTTILGDARFLATSDISLVNADPAGQLLVVGNAYFESGDAITVGVDTTAVNFGTLTFNALGIVEITESNATSGLAAPAAGMTIVNTAFDGGKTNHAGSLTLRSDSFIQDATGTTVEVDAAANFLAATAITLADDAGDTLQVGGNAAFTSSGGQQIDVGVTPTTSLATDRGTDSGATVELGSLQFNSVGGDVTVQEDLGMLLAGANQAGTLVLVANQGDLRDQAATAVTVTGFAEFHAENDVVLADQSGDLLSVGGNALFTSGNTNYFATPAASREISVGVVDVDAAANPNDPARGADSGASVLLGSVTLNGLANLDDGVQATIRADGSLVITHAERREGGGSTEITNFAQTAVLIADNVADDATITDAQIDGVGGTSIETTSYAVFQADSHVTLANEAADSLVIGENAYFASQLGDVELGVITKAVNALDRGADSGATVQFGSLTFLAALGDVTIHEDDGTTLANGNALRDTGGAANSLVLESGGEIDDAAGTNLVVAQLTTPPVAGSAADQVDGLAVLRTANDVHLGDSVGDAVDFRRLSLSVGGDVSITETSATDGGLLLVDGSAAGGTLAVRTSGHLVQINDERTGAPFSLITADQALLIAGGGVVLTNVDFNQVSLQAHGTLQVTPGATLNADDAANGGLLGRRTTDAISSYLPDSNDDTFAPKGPSTTPDTQTNMDGAYSIILSDVDELTIGLVADAKGTIAVDPVTLAFQVAGTADFATADFNPALSAVGVAAGHLFVQTVGDLTFAENGADPLDNVVVYGEVRMTGPATTNNAFTALSGGTLNIAGDSLLVMRSAADFYLFNPNNNTLTPYVGGGLADSIGSLGAVHAFATFVDVDTQPGFVQVGEFGPIYQRTAQSPDPDASTSQIAKALSNGQFQVNATISKLGDSSTVEVDGQQVYVEQNFRVLVDWGDGSQTIYLFQDPIDGAQTLQHTYDSSFARSEQRTTVTITAFNDPQINLYDNVVDDTTFRDLNSVADTFEVVFPIGVQFAPEPPPFELPAAPEIAPVALLPEIVFAVSTNSTYESDGGLLNQVQEVVVVIVNALDEEVGERIVLQGISTIEEVKQFIQDSTRFLPGRYKVSILLAGQQEPDVYYFEKTASDAPEGASGGGAALGRQLERYVRIDAPQAATEASPEQVWAAQYDLWFDADEEPAGEAAAPAVESWTPDLSAVLLREEQAEAAEEQTYLQKRWMLPGGIGGALMMAAYAIRPQADQQRSAAMDQALESSTGAGDDGDLRLSRRRWRRRVR